MLHEPNQIEGLDLRSQAKLDELAAEKAKVARLTKTVLDLQNRVLELRLTKTEARAVVSAIVKAGVLLGDDNLNQALMQARKKIRLLAD